MIRKNLRDESKKIAIDYGCDRIELNCQMFNENALAMYEHIGYNRQRIIYEMKLQIIKLLNSNTLIIKIKDIIKIKIMIQLFRS